MTLPARALAPVLVVIVALAGCAAPPPAPPPALKRIEGTQWVSTERSAGGLGVIYTFLSGGRVVETAARRPTSSSVPGAAASCAC